MPGGPTAAPPGSGTPSRWHRIPWSLRVLAMVQLLIGFGVGLFVVLPPLPTTPRALDAAAVVVAVVLAVVTLVAVPRLPPWALAVSVGATSVLLAVLTLAMPTPQGQVEVALGLVMLCIYAAQHLHGRALIIVVAITVVAYVAALLATQVLPGAATYAVGITMLLLGITAQVARLEGRLRYQALHDPLTGVLNRNGLAERAPTVRDLAARSSRETTVALIDLDGFKAYNDEHGHDGGDDALVRLASSWSPLLRSSDLVGRYGGDEFALVLPGSTPDDVAGLLRRLQQASPLPWSAGAQVWRPDEDLFAALARADLDLYRAKRAHDAATEVTAPRSG